MIFGKKKSCNQFYWVSLFLPFLLILSHFFYKVCQIFYPYSTPIDVFLSATKEVPICNCIGLFKFRKIALKASKSEKYFIYNLTIFKILIKLLYVFIKVFKVCFCNLGKFLSVKLRQFIQNLANIS